MFAPRRLVAACLFASLSWVPALADAQDRPRDPVAAEKLYDDGTKRLAADDWAAGCQLFAQSFELDPAPGTLLNLASCAEREGKLALAWSRYRDARSLNSDTKSAQQKQDIEAFIAGAIARLDPRIPQLTVRVAGAPPGLTIRRNNLPMVADVALPVDPGTQIVEIEAPGYRTVRRELTLAESARETLDVQLETDVATPGGPGTVPPPALPPPPPETESGGLGTLGVAGLVVGGIGLVGIGVSIATGVVALGAEGELEDLSCSPTSRGTTACPAANTAAAEDASSRGSTFATVSTITTFVGGAALGTGILLLLLDDGKKPSSPAQGLRFVPAAGPTGGGLSIRGAL